MKVLIFMRNIFRKYPRLFIWNILLILAENLTDAASLLVLIPVIDFLIKPGAQGGSFITKRVMAFAAYFGMSATLTSALLIFLIINIGKIGFQLFSKYSVLKTKYTFVSDMMIGTFRDFFNAKWYFFSSNKEGTLLNTFNREISIVAETFGTMANFFAGIIKALFYLAVPFYLSWQVASISVALAIFFALPFALLGKINYKLGKLNVATSNRLTAIIHEAISTAKIILGYGLKDKSVKTLNGAFDDHRRITIKAQTLGIVVMSIYYPFSIFVLVIGVLMAQKFAIPLSEAAVLFYALLKVIPSFGELTAQKNSIENAIPSYEQIMNLRQRAVELKKRSGRTPFVGLNKEILIDRLSFAYPGHKPVLSGVNVRVPKGRMIAFVGESGSGKTTLIDMIMGFHEPLEGSITIDGIPLQNIEVDSYRLRIGYVPQDSALFNMTIRENLLWACESASMSDIEHSCRQANAEEFIRRFPKGYDTVVGDRGVRLSGGQLQRIALARAILKKPQILILDEATSSLDTNFERLIQDAIENIAKETTVIVIAHRLSTIVNADYIYVLKSGRIIEEGAYPQLINKNSEFYNMVKQQALETVPAGGA